MMMLRWKSGRTDRGCLYHVLARFPHEADTYQIDVFVMPSIAHLRPIAITVGRYCDGDEVEKRKLSVGDPIEANNAKNRVTAALSTMGCDADFSTYAGAAVAELLQRDSARIRSALARARV